MPEQLALFVDPGSRRVGVAISRGPSPSDLLRWDQLRVPEGWETWRRLCALSDLVVEFAVRSAREIGPLSVAVVETPYGARRGPQHHMTLVVLGAAYGMFRYSLRLSQGAWCSTNGGDQTRGLDAIEWTGSKKAAEREVATAERFASVLDSTPAENVKQRPDMLAAIGMSEHWWTRGR